jgi:hypothetical protein
MRGMQELLAYSLRLGKMAISGEEIVLPSLLALCKDAAFSVPRINKPL